MTLRAALTKLIARLRAREVRISVAEALDAAHALIATGLDRNRMREGLAASLIKDEADRATFDEVFSQFFGRGEGATGRVDNRPSRRTGVIGSSGPGPGAAAPDSSRPPDDKERSEDLPASDLATSQSPDLRENPVESHPEEPTDNDGSSADPASRASIRAERVVPPTVTEKAADFAERDDFEQNNAAGRAAQLRALERTPFTDYTALEFGQARAILAPLERRFRIRVGRRLRIAHAGRLDFRRTLRASLQHGGVLAELRRRARRPRHVELVILADISGSVQYAAALLLEIAAGASSCFRRVHSFVYVDRLARADFERGYLIMTPQLDLFARSDFGRVLTELWERRALLNRATVVVILGDGRNNRRPARTDCLVRIARMVRAVIWLNPEPRERWGTGDSAIFQYAREVSVLLACGNLRELELGLTRIA